MSTDRQLCYLEASKVQSPAGDLESFRLQSENDEALGTLDGVLIDPSQRRLQFYVVERSGWFRSRRYLVPADRPAQITDDQRTLRLALEPGELEHCERFDARSTPQFSDEDVVTAMFAPRMSENDLNAA